MTTTATSAVVLSSPGAYIANVPSLIGFEPRESVIATWMRWDSIIVTQRADVEDALNDPRGFFEAIERSPEEPTGVILVLWSDTIPSDDPRYADLCNYADGEWDVKDAMWVSDGRWGSIACSDPMCCPPDGRPIDPCLKAQPLSEPLTTRDDLLDECRPHGEQRMKPLDPHGIEGWRDKQIDRMTEAFTRGSFESSKHVHRAGRALHDIRVRDVMLWQVTNYLDLDQLRDAYDFACSVAREMHPADAAPACTVAAIIAWQMGDGARANIAADYARAADPAYSLLALMDMALKTAMPPRAWAEAMSGLSYDVVRNGEK